MITIACPSCAVPMDIEENELNTEWECPDCGSAFTIQTAPDGTLQYSITEVPVREPTPDQAHIETPGNLRTVACPSCRESVDIEGDEADAEWECPGCGTGFLVKTDEDGRARAIQIDDADEPEPEPESEPEEDEIADEAYTYALERLLKGRTTGEVRRSLLDSGYSDTQADQIMRTAIKYQRQSAAGGVQPAAPARPGARNIVIGGVICMLGVLVTCGSSGSVIAWGAIVCGGMLFVAGLMQASGPRR
jgi:transposase-like protein